MSGPKKLVFLHLSDIHFKKVKGIGGAEAIDQDIRDQLLKDCDRILGDVGGTVHQIIISGDVAFSGQPDEYNTAREWIAKLGHKVNCAPDAIRMVCGNHDIDRGVAKSSQSIRDIQERLRKEPVATLSDYIKAIVECPHGGPAAFGPLSNYNRFAESPYQSHFNPARPFWTHPLVLNDGSFLKLCGLNSALASNAEDSEEHNKLVVGEGYCVLQEVEGTEHLAICHHPPSWLRDDKGVERRLDNRARIQLFGHVHEPKIELRGNDQFRCLRLHAGAVTPPASDKTMPCYNCLTIEVNGTGKARKMVVEVFPRIWDADNLRFDEDFKLTKGHRKCKFELPLPPSKPDSRAINTAVLESIPVEPANIISDPLNVVTSTNPHAKKLVELRRLAYMFLNLTYHAQVSVAMALAILQDEDRSVSPSVLFQRLYTRAQDKGMVARFWDLVNQQQPTPRSDTNPFL